VSPYRMSALVLRTPSFWERVRKSLNEFWVSLRSRKCEKRNGHSWIVSRFWDFKYYRPDLYMQIPPSNLGMDAVCEDCGKTLQTFQKTGEVLRACRSMKGSDPIPYTGRRLIREIEPILLDTCLPKDSATFPQKGYRVAHDHDPNDVFDEKYVFEGVAIPEYKDDSA